MKKMKLLLLLVVFSISVYAQNEEKAKIVIMRNSGFSGATNVAKIAVNGEDFLNLPNNYYYEYYVDPGNYNFTASMSMAGKKKGEELVKINAEINKTYYIEVNIQYGMILRIYLEEITENTFLKRKDKMELFEKKK